MDQGERITGEPPNRLPADLRRILPADTARAWRELAPLLPEALYLGGETAVAAHLHHRTSRDLDFLFHNSAVDLEKLGAQLQNGRRFALTEESPGTLKGLYGQTRLEFFHADQYKPQKLLRQTSTVSGLRVASLRDLAAMKLKAIGDRSEMRDYFDVKLIEEQGAITVEDGIAYFLRRYDVSPNDTVLKHIVVALGYLDDVEEDKLLPITKLELERWWKTRQRTLISNLSRIVG